MAHDHSHLHSDGQGGHSHSGGTENRRALATALAITAAYTAAEVIGGLITGSLALLAGEQEAGRLRIRPVLLVLSAEGLPTGEYNRIANAFGAKVRHSYAATECPFLSYSCEHGWLHVNSDWVVLEPVDADHRPVP